jgi:hypothetical protein
MRLQCRGTEHRRTLLDHLELLIQKRHFFNPKSSAVSKRARELSPKIIEISI